MKEGKMGNRYKFRAECLTDVTGFLDNLWPGCDFIGCFIKHKDRSTPFSGVEVDLVIRNTDLDEIRCAMSVVRDSHVMIESLNYAEKYTGRRYSRNTHARIQAIVEILYKETKNL